MNISLRKFLPNNVWRRRFSLLQGPRKVLQGRYFMQNLIAQLQWQSIDCLQTQRIYLSMVCNHLLFQFFWLQGLGIDFNHDSCHVSHSVSVTHCKSLSVTINDRVSIIHSRSLCCWDLSAWATLNVPKIDIVGRSTRTKAVKDWKDLATQIHSQEPYFRVMRQSFVLKNLGFRIVKKSKYKPHKMHKKHLYVFAKCVRFW